MYVECEVCLLLIIDNKWQECQEIETGVRFMVHFKDVQMEENGMTADNSYLWLMEVYCFLIIMSWKQE